MTASPPLPGVPTQEARRPPPPDEQSFHRLKLITIVKGAGLSLGGGLFGRALTYTFNLYAAKAIGLQGFGLFTLALTILRYISIGTEGGQSSAVVHYVSIYHARNDQARVKGTILLALRVVLALSLALALALVLASDLLATKVFQRPELAGPLLYVAISIPFTAVSAVLLRATVALQTMKFQVLTQDICRPAIALILLGLLVFYGFRLHALILAYVLAAIAEAAIAYLLFARAFRHIIFSPLFPSPEARRVQPIFSRKEMQAFSFPLFTGRLFSRLMKHADHLILSFFVPMRELGLYSILHKTAFALIEIPSSLMEVLGPLISRSVSEGDLSRLERQIQVASKWIFALCLPVILFILLHPVAVLSVLGEQFVTGTTSFIILCIGAFFAFSSGPTALALTMSGNTTVTMWNTIGLGLASLILYGALIPPFGVRGAAIAFAVTSAAVAVVRFVETRLLLQVRPWSKEFLKPAAAAVAAMLLTLLLELLLPANKYLFLGLSLTSYLLTYLALLVLLGLDPEDRFILNKVRERLLHQAPQNTA